MVAVVLWKNCEIAWSPMGAAAAIIRNNFGRFSISTRGVRSMFYNRAEGDLMRLVPSRIKMRTLCTDYPSYSHSLSLLASPSMNC